MYCCILLKVQMLNRHVPVYTGMYWYIPRYTDFSIYRYVRVCTFPEKYIRICTGMYFTEKVYTDLYYSIVQIGTYLYIPVHTDLHQV